MTLTEKLERLPRSPGVYLMKGREDQILYIGKANCLADRVRSYFQRGAALTPKIRSMVEQVEDIEWLVTMSELEALVLENNLIKKHRPKYNVVLRDDKNYPFLRLAMQEDYPRPQIVRRVKRDGALYFGPYVPTNALRETLRVLRWVFPLPNCKIKIDGKADRPCIEFEIKRCLAPCTGHQSREDYRAMIEQVRLFLEGKDRELLDRLKTRMTEAAERLDFEEAARMRDTLHKVERTLEKQRVTSTDLTDRDVVVLCREQGSALIQVMFIRGGMLIGRKDFLFKETGEVPDTELYRTFIQQFYARPAVVPPELLLPVPLPERALLGEWLSEKRGGPVVLRTPDENESRQLVRLAEENAGLCLRERLGSQAAGGESLAVLQRTLGLRVLPRRIEAFDISDIFGDQAVGSLVVCVDGQMVRSEYRRFRIRTVTGANDFAMMGEVVRRRYTRLKKRAEPLPDLILIDGGKGQLSAARDVLEQLDLEQVAVIGLAKARGEKGERIFLPGTAQPIVLPPTSPATHLLQRIRDEAHRFAIGYHRNLRGKALVESILDSIEGIGATRKRILLQRFGSLEGIRNATLGELEAIPELGRAVAGKLHRRLSTIASGSQDPIEPYPEQAAAEQEPNG